MSLYRGARASWFGGGLTAFILAASLGLVFSHLRGEPDQLPSSGDRSSDYRRPQALVAGGRNLGVPEATSFHTAGAAVTSLSRYLGDETGSAACELGSVYLYCASLDQEAARLEDLARKNIQRGVGVDFLSRLERTWQAKADYCAGLEPVSAAQVIEYFRGSAELGNSYAQGVYLSGQLFSGRTLEAIEQLSAYRADAERLALQAVREGNVGVSMQLADAYGQRHNSAASLLREAVRPDAARAVSLYRFILSRLDEGSPESVPARMAIEGRIRALRKSYPDLVDDKDYASEWGVSVRAFSYSNLSRATNPQGRVMGECQYR